MDRVTADHMGMLATIMNSLALEDAIEKQGVPVRVQTALSIPSVAEPFILRKAIRHFECGRVVVFACGTGNPYFSTDTAAVLRAAEIGAEIVLFAKNIDGVYTADPKVDPNAKKLDSITYDEIIHHDLTVIDSTASAFGRDNNLPLLLFGLNDPENIYRAVNGEKIGTIVSLG
jgi:uridylate kinase